MNRWTGIWDDTTGGQKRELDNDMRKLIYDVKLLEFDKVCTVRKVKFKMTHDESLK